jgi:hypothetical protein
MERIDPRTLKTRLRRIENCTRSEIIAVEAILIHRSAPFKRSRWDGASISIRR